MEFRLKRIIGIITQFIFIAKCYVTILLDVAKKYCHTTRHFLNKNSHSYSTFFVYLTYYGI